MTRMIDLMAVGAFHEPVDRGLRKETHDRRASLVPEALAAEKFNIDNVLPAYPQGRAGNWPVLAPPFPYYWIEYRGPASGQKVGGLFVATTKDGGWSVTAYLGYEHRKVAVFPFGSCTYRLEPSGAPSNNMDIEVYGEPVDDEIVFGQMSESATWIYAAAQPMLFATNLINCKNVSAMEVVPPPKLSKKWEKKHGLPKMTVKTLDIKPMTSRPRRSTSGSGTPQSLHVARGHFKDYRESGLFGRNRGVYWWDSQLRGNPQVGEVVKDYRVNPPVDRGPGPATPV